MCSPSFLENVETENLLTGFEASPWFTEEMAKLPDCAPILSVAGMTALIAKFLLPIFLGLVGRIIFYLFLGLKMVGDDTGDFPLSVFPICTAEGLSFLIFFMLIGSFKLSALRDGSMSFVYMA
jgi:hypothetical protein